MKKIFLALAIIISCTSIISCDADSISDNFQTNAESGGTGTVPPVKPPPPPGTGG